MGPAVADHVLDPYTPPGRLSSGWTADSSALSPPSAGRIEASYACVGREPDIRTTYTLELDYERVRITAYSGPNGVATAEQLAEWNEGLLPIRSVQVHHFDCRRDGESLVIRGVDRDGDGDVGLMITARGGEMQSLPLGQERLGD